MTPYTWCADCHSRRVKRPGGVCAGCHQAAHPLVDGAEIRAERDQRGVTIMAIAAALDMAPRQYIDTVEYADVDRERAAEVLCLIEELADAQYAPAPQQGKALPPDALSIEAIERG